MNDMLKYRKNLQKMPYTVPEGYFKGLKTAMGQKMKPASHVWSGKPVYAAAAAVFAILLAAGGFFLGTVSERAYSLEKGSSDKYAAVLSEDDLIEYLIYTDTELEELY